MEVPSIYTQPVDQLENFEMSGDDLTVIANLTTQENDPSESAKIPAEANNTGTTNKE